MTKSSVIFLLIAAYFSNTSLAQKIGNGGNICEDGIRAYITYLARNTPSSQGIQFGGLSQANQVYIQLQSADLKENANLGTEWFQITQIATSNGLRSLVEYNPAVCNEQRGVRNLEAVVRQLAR